jgi:small GTP-binding protein
MNKKSGAEKIDYTIRIAVYGTYSVGKTSLAKRWVEDVYSKTSPTIGAGFFTRTREIDGSKVKCQIWDTAGSEKFKSIVPIYLRQAEACLVCFDAMDVESVKKMVEFVIDVKPELYVVLVKTKCDISCSIDDPEEFRNYVREKGYPYYETSSKTGQNVDNMFVDTFKMCVEKERRAKNLEPDNIDLDEEDPVSTKGCCVIL